MSKENEKKNKKIREKANKTLDRAESYLSKELHERAYKEFSKAGEQFYELTEFKIAEQCYFFASKALVHEGIYKEASLFMRKSANCCVLYDDYSKAGDYYDISAKYSLKSDRKNAEFNSILSACFAYLCWFLRGQQDKGLSFIKRIKRNVDSKEFAEHHLVRLVKGLTLAILNKEEAAITVLEKDFFKFKFGEAETKLIKAALLMAKVHLLMKYNLITDKQEVLNNEEFTSTLNVTFLGISDLVDDDFLDFQLDSIRILKSRVNLSDNLTIKGTSIFPVKVEDESADVSYNIRANFPGEAYIGPISFTVEVNEIYYITENSNSIELKVKSPPTQLNINLKPLINPIINQTFQMEIKISNQSESDAVNISIDFEFPEGLRLMRGTKEKKIYQVIRNGEFKWVISLKPLEPGTHIIKATVFFNDQDGNAIGPNTASLPFEINL